MNWEKEKLSITYLFVFYFSFVRCETVKEHFTYAFILFYLLKFEKILKFSWNFFQFFGFVKSANVFLRAF